MAWTSRLLVSLIYFWGIMSAANAQQDCSAVLRDGAFRSSSVQTNGYVRQVLAARLTHLSKSDAESSAGAGLTAPIEGVPIGANYSDKQYQSWLDEVRQSLDVNDLNSRSDSILTASGDDTIVNGWIECIRLNSSGFWVKLKPVGDNDVELSLLWLPGPGATDTVYLSDDIIPSGATIVSGGSLIKKGSPLHRQNTVFVGLRRVAGASVYVAVNTSAIGGSGYLPRLISLPAIKPDDSLTLSIPPLSYPFPLPRNGQGKLIKTPGGHKRTFGNACNYGRQPYNKGIQEIMILNGNVDFVAPGDEVWSTPSASCPVMPDGWQASNGPGGFWVTTVERTASRTLVYGFWALAEDME